MVNSGTLLAAIIAVTAAARTQGGECDADVLYSSAADLDRLASVSSASVAWRVRAAD